MNEYSDVLLIKGGQKDWYEQIIFIPKKGIPKVSQPKDLVTEAELIVQNYIRNNSKKLNSAFSSNSFKKNKTQKLCTPKSKTFDTVLNICLLLSIVFFVLAAYHFFI